MQLTAEFAPSPAGIYYASTQYKVSRAAAICPSGRTEDAPSHPHAQEDRDAFQVEAVHTRGDCKRESMNILPPNRHAGSETKRREGEARRRGDIRQS